MAADRLDLIREHLYTNGSVSVQDLCTATGASPATVRRDLQRLEDDGAVERTHGGVRLAGSAGMEVSFRVRENLNIRAKRLIAKRAHGLIRPHTTIFFDAGTTVLQVARLLRLHPLPVAVFTNGLAVANELANLPDLQVSVLGGVLRRENLSFIGPLAEQILGQIWFDQLFLGFTAAHEDGFFHTLDAGEASLNQMMLTRAAETILLADSNKFLRRATYRVASFRAPLRLISDDDLSAEWRQRLREAGVGVDIVRGDEAS